MGEGDAVHFLYTGLLERAACFVKRRACRRDIVYYHHDTFRIEDFLDAHAAQEIRQSLRAFETRLGVGADYLFKRFCHNSFGNQPGECPSDIRTLVEAAPSEYSRMFGDGDEKDGLLTAEALEKSGEIVADVRCRGEHERIDRFAASVVFEVANREAYCSIAIIKYCIGTAAKTGGKREMRETGITEGTPAHPTTFAP